MHLIANEFLFQTMKKLSLLYFLLVAPVFYAFAQPANDDFADAIDVTGILNTCSSDAAYTTLNATSDLNSGNCWNNTGPKFNVWFSFTAAT